MDERSTIKKTTLQGIADAIKRKEGSDEPIPVVDFEDRIDGISTENNYDNMSDLILGGNINGTD